MAATENPDTTSTRPYLIRAIHEWCCDNQLTPYVTVAVDNSVQVPKEYVQNDEIVLNVAYGATTALNIGNDYLEFKARFGGVARDIIIPIDCVLAIFSRENGQGMAFPRVERVALNTLSSKPALASESGEDAQSADPVKPPIQTGKPTLTRIK